MSESAYARSAAFYDQIYGAKPYADEAARLHRAIQAHLRSGGNALLDVGCGSGNHMAHLRDRYRCDGVDLDAGLLDIARRRLADSHFFQADMAHFDLGRRYDVLTCLFSAIGYVRTVERLRDTMRSFARHLHPGGVAVVEPWLTPDAFTPGTVRLDASDTPELKVARMTHSSVHDGVSVLAFSYLVGRTEGVERLEERHELGLFTVRQMRDAFGAAGLEVVEHDPHGLAGRGLYVARLPG